MVQATSILIRPKKSWHQNLVDNNRQFCYSIAMSDLSRFQKKITCPRCGIKIVQGVTKCPDCGLIFSRLEIATNKDAKKLIQRHEKDFVLKSSKLPSDVSFIKLLLLCILLGPLGAHCFYVGRYIRGGVLLADMALLFLLVLFNSQLLAVDNGALLGSLTTIAGIIMLIWPWDLIMIIMKKFKVPIAIDISAQNGGYHDRAPQEEQTNLKESDISEKKIEYFPKEDKTLQNADNRTNDADEEKGTAKSADDIYNPIEWKKKTGGGNKK